MVGGPIYHLLKPFFLFPQNPGNSRVREKAEGLGEVPLLLGLREVRPLPARLWGGGGTKQKVGPKQQRQWSMRFGVPPLHCKALAGGWGTPLPPPKPPPPIPTLTHW